jgi:hypothetical protein
MRFPLQDSLPKKMTATKLRIFLMLTTASSLIGLSLASSPALAQQQVYCTSGTGTSLGCFADQATCQSATCATQPCPPNLTCNCAASNPIECPPASAAASAATAPPPPTQLINPLGTSDIRVLAGRIINVFTGVAGSIALAMFVYGGFLMVTAGGNDEMIKKGKNAMVWAVIGLVVMFGAYAVLSYFFNAIGNYNPNQ